ncbi:MAG: M10 family metallopeptidase C-terminal domain-containing protein, partial [Parvularculaceae bacterium]|nr:M10 family metallopeptidase C-terminal domain-containing protein [Parvularculaceae bacterium]
MRTYRESATFEYPHDARFVAEHAAPLDAPADDAPLCGCAFCGSSDLIERFVPPTSGTSSNGKTIFSWDEAASQLTRSGNSWSSVLGQGITITYAFRATAPATMPSDTTGFSQFGENQIQFAEKAFQLWSDIANIVFVRTGSGSTGAQAYSNDAAILLGNYATGESGAAAFAYLPVPGRTAPSQSNGDIWVNISLADNANLTFGGYGPHTLAHEIGHAIGLKHPSDYNGGSPTYSTDASYWQDARMFTIMSYFGSTNTGGNLPMFSVGPQLHDIAAAQRLYGPNLSTRTGDTVYGFNSNTGREHTTITSAANGAVFAIWDAGGNDTLDLSGYATDSEIDLRQESFSSAGPGNSGNGVAVGNISIARGAVIENATGGSGNDTITGN